MAGEVLGAVLAFAVRVVVGRAQDPCAVRPGTLVMRVDVIDPDHHRMRQLRVAMSFAPPFGQHHGAVADVELRAVGADLQTNSESEGGAEPGGKEAPDVLKRTVLERFAGWPDPVRSFVEATDDANTFLADTYDRV